MVLAYKSRNAYVHFFAKIEKASKNQGSVYETIH
jgi:hypothetical protein